MKLNAWLLYAGHALCGRHCATGCYMLYAPCLVRLVLGSPASLQRSSHHAHITHVCRLGLCSNKGTGGLKCSCYVSIATCHHAVFPGGGDVPVLFTGTAPFGSLQGACCSCAAHVSSTSLVQVHAGMALHAALLPVLYP